MSMDVLQEIRERGRKVKESRRDEKTDYREMTAPCGLPCFECYLYLAQFDRDMAELIAGVHQVPTEVIACRGCRAEDGKCAHHAGECRVFRCVEKTEMQTCAECNDFPCEYLHPYSDQAMKPHNTKVFHLCRIRKLGIERWAKEEAGDILDRYWYGTWTL